MKKNHFLLLFFSVLAIQHVSAQEVLPGITVKDFNGKIVVSWQNAYNVPVTNINIQRSFDSLKNYSTIGSVLNPQNLENGFADDNPPYKKMYYRVFISFEGGSYLFSSIRRPVKIIPEKKDPVPEEPVDSTGIIKNTDSIVKVTPIIPSKNIPNFPWKGNNMADSIARALYIRDSIAKATPTYPSQRIYTGKENNIVIYLRDAPLKKYTVKFYDEADNFLFELTKLKEEYLVVEKVNFVHSGWFHFELFESGKSIEKNKFFIGKDGKEGKKGNN